jgi:voltage-gated potassium channel
MDRLKRRLFYTLSAIVMVLAIGTAGFTVIEHWPPFDSFYMTLTTMTTVGYGEVHPLTNAGRVFNSFLIAIGVAVIFIAIGAMTQSIIEMEFGEALSQRRNKRMIHKLENHFIVCGYGRVGRGAAEELQRSAVPFVVTDIDPERVQRAMTAGMMAVNADATRDQTLRDIGIGRARGLVAALASDADNLFTILSAKGLNPNLYIATRAAEEGAEQKMRRAGADAVLAPYALTGHRLAQCLLRPHVVQFLDLTTQNIGLNVDIEQVTVGETAEFTPKSIKDMQIRRDLGVIVLAIRKHDGSMLFNPPADTLVVGGDCLIVMGEQDNLRRLETLLAEARTVERDR